MENEQKVLDFLNKKHRGKLVDSKETLELAKQLLLDFLNEKDFKSIEENINERIIEERGSFLKKELEIYKNVPVTIVKF